MSTIFKNRISFGYDWIQIGKILSFLISSSLFVATICFLATYFSFLLYTIEPNLALLFSAFFTTLGTYNFNKLTDKDEDAINRPERVDYVVGKEKLILYLSIFSYIIALILGLFESFLTVIVILFPLISGYAYSVKISPKIPRLKDITGVKSIVVATAWAVVVALLPVIYPHHIKLQVILIFYFIFNRVFIGTVLFDVRDMEGDRGSGTNTIPVVIGLPKTKKLLLIFHSTLIPWLILSFHHGLFVKYLPVLIFAIAYGYFHIFYFCNEEATYRKDLSFDLIVDGEWIPIVMLAFIFSPFI